MDRIYISDFLAEEDGIETIEFIGMLAVAAVMIAAIAKVATSMKGKMKGLANNI